MTSPASDISELVSRRRKMTSSGQDPDSDATTKVPDFGLRLKMNHVYPENRSQNYTPSFRVIWMILPLLLRYVWYYIKSKCTGKSIVMDFLCVQRSKQCYGVPLGGIGCGSIGRGYKGEFTRFQLRPGIYEYNTVDANQFIVTIKDGHQETIFHSLLSTYKKKGLKSWTSQIDATKCKYTGLYPRAWAEYDLSEYGVILKCRQVSPIISQDYQTSAIPVAVFVWSVQNICKEERTVTVSFTFKNGTGNSKLDRGSTCSSKSFCYYNRTEGVLLHHTIDKMPCTYALGAKLHPNLTVTKCLQFDPNSDGIQPWIQLKNNGSFEKNPEMDSKQVVGEMGVGIACKVALQPSSWDVIEMSLAWDMPTVYFGQKGKKYQRFYTEQFGVENAAVKIVDFALSLYKDWDRLIYEWQKPVLTNKNLPDWYKSALYNESYFISDGGSVWLALDNEEKDKLEMGDPRLEVGRFAYLEGHEYKMYNSYDVHFYASHALSKTFPLLQQSLHYDLRDAVSLELPQKIEMLYDGQVVERKVPNTVPHDNGDPGEEPFLLPNSYPIHDVSRWRDLGSKFVLQTYRDAIATSQIDRRYVQHMYNTCYIVMKNLRQYDVDDDGLIENSGHPDQTFDIWTMTGASAYCGGLWLAALHVMTLMAKALDKQEDVTEFQTLLDKGKVSFDRKLWNGQYYNFDCSEKEAQSIMADQLCFQWYLRCCGIKDYPIIPKENVINTLKTIYQYNVQSFCDGTMGAVNGFLGGDVDTFAIQSEEVWTGVTYALASNLIFEGMLEEGLVTAGGMYRSMRDTFGLAFDTPEALYAKKYYRSIGYMRPLSIWSMQIAIEELQHNQSA